MIVTNNNDKAMDQYLFMNYHWSGDEQPFTRLVYLFLMFTRGTGIWPIPTMIMIIINNDRDK